MDTRRPAHIPRLPASSPRSHRPAASPGHLLQDLGPAVRAQRGLVHGRLLALPGRLRWTLIVVFMLLKAGLIVAVFMHMVWERLALLYAIVVPPLLLFVLLGIGALEAEHTFLTRGTFFAPGNAAPAAAHK